LVARLSGDVLYRTNEVKVFNFLNELEDIS